MGCGTHRTTPPTRPRESLHTARSIAALLSFLLPDVSVSNVSKMPSASTTLIFPSGGQVQGAALAQH
eukprot:6943835-Pyramimonas_sp.AAC.1